MENVVIDANIVLACLLNEPEKAKILERTNGLGLVAPASLPWEVCNALSAAFKKKRFNNVKVAHQLLKEFAEIPIKLHHINFCDTIDICFRKNIYAYDAYMIACAHQTRAPLITLDNRLRVIAQEENIKVLELL
jgi:predicted nucleic acid-binding protein